MKENLLILGAGQYGCVAREIAEATNHFKKIAFLDDCSVCAIGPLAEYDKRIKDYSHAFVAIGNAETRVLWLNKLKSAGYSLATLVHPQASVSPSAKIGDGSIVEPMAVVQSNAVVGEGSMIASGAVVKHNATVGNGCYIDCNSVVSAGAKVPDGVKVFANTVTEERK